jgi:1,2-diacylglycerol 3-alpha-glucosyltransferase/glucuronosyltransferase
LHILIVTDAWHPQVNGVVRVLDTLRTRLMDRGFEVTVISPNDFITIPCPGYAEIPLALFPQRKIRARLKRMRPDVIHIATEGPVGWAMRKICLKKGLPFTTAYHTKFPQYVHERAPISLERLYGLMRKFHGPSECVFAPSHTVAEELESFNFKNVFKWSHGVDTDSFSPQEKDFFDLPRPIHMYIGRIAVEKNLPAFLDLDLPGSKVVVGPGPMREELMEKYPDVLFHLSYSDRELALCYSAADVFVFPSLTDTFGLVMAESLACGVPIAAFPVSGPLDVFGQKGACDMSFGALHEDLGEAVKLAYNKSPQACRSHAMNFSWKQVVDEFLDKIVPIDPALKDKRWKVRKRAARFTVKKAS